MQLVSMYNDCLCRAAAATMVRPELLLCTSTLLTFLVVIHAEDVIGKAYIINYLISMAIAAFF